MNLEKRLDDWKKHLLDLGKRNALINFKLDSKSILQFTNPTMTELWNSIIENDGSIEFPCIIEKTTSDEEELNLKEYEYGKLSKKQKV